MSFPLRHAHLFGQLIKRRDRAEIYWCEPDMGADRALRRRVADMETFNALFRPDAVRICDALNDVPEGRPILAGSSLGKLQGSVEIYFLDSGYARLIDDWLVLERCNFNPGKVKEMSWNVLESHAGSTSVSELYRHPPLRYPTVDIDDGEWATFVEALKSLKRAGRYDPLIQVHSDHLEEIHSLRRRNIDFLPWHRVFLLELNRLIQDHIGNPTVGFPYFWSWTIDGERAGYRGDIWREDRLGGYGEPIQSGPFQPTEWRTISPVGNSTYEAGLRRTLIFENFPTPADIRRLLAEPSFEEFTNKFELGVHGWIHKGIGGHMGNLHHSPNEPAFWLHHGNVDRIWSRWQRANPAEDARAQDVYGSRLLPPTDLRAGTRRWTFAEACRVDRTLVGYSPRDEWSGD